MPRGVRTAPNGVASRIFTNLCVSSNCFDNVESLARHGCVQTSLEVAQILVSLSHLGIRDAFVDTIRQRLIGRLSAATLGKLAREGLARRMVLRHGGLVHGRLSMMARRHDGTFGRHR